MADIQNKKSGKRRKDYVTGLAIGLFLFIVMLEVMLVTWLPKQLTSEALWSRDVAMTELIDLEDTLRKNVKYTLKFRDKWDEGESKMGLNCLNNIAPYLRKHQADMNQEQIRQLYLILQKFETRFNQWKDRKYSITSEKIDIQPILKKTLDTYKNDNNRQPKTEKNNILFQD
jgi:hypothetical protein